MLESFFALYLSTRDYPGLSNLNGEILHEKFVHEFFSENANHVFSNQDLGIVVKSTLSGWSVSADNKSNIDKVFIIDCNSNKVDINKPCRVKVKLPSGLKQQIESQKDEAVAKPWNYVQYKNSVVFDVIEVKPLFVVGEEETFLWNVSSAPSTPFIKNVISMNIKPSEKIYFEISIAESCDLNFDNFVDAKDLSILLDNWGKPFGDVNGDGKTDASDQSILLNSFTKDKSDE